MFCQDLSAGTRRNVDSDGDSSLTNKAVKALGLVVPVDSQEIDRDTSQHDGEADAAHHGLRVKREDEQEGPEDEVNDRPYEADLEERKNRLSHSQLQKVNVQL